MRRRLTIACSSALTAGLLAFLLAPGPSGEVEFNPKTVTQNRLGMFIVPMGHGSLGFNTAAEVRLHVSLERFVSATGEFVPLTGTNHQAVIRMDVPRLVYTWSVSPIGNAGKGRFRLTATLEGRAGFGLRSFSDRVITTNSVEITI